ncbi:MAG: hypothetical protein VW270_07820, partial [Candidatus Poseidoniales archaeon]
LMKPLAYLVAILHPKLSIKRLRESLGKHVNYDVKGTFQDLQLPNFEMRTTLIDAVVSLEQYL